MSKYHPQMLTWGPAISWRLFQRFTSCAPECSCTRLQHSQREPIPGSGENIGQERKKINIENHEMHISVLSKIYTWQFAGANVVSTSLGRVSYAADIVSSQ